MQALGPILRFRGTTPDHARLSVTTVGAPDAGSRPLGALAGTDFHAADLLLPRDVAGGVTLPDGRHLALPRADAPLRIAFASCNGAEDDATFDAVPGGRGAMWRDLAERHAEAPFHLLVLGGDQIYADAVWHLPEIAGWATLPRRARLAAPWTDAMRAAAEAHYRDTYMRAFGAPEAAAMLAQVPSVMIWDDHDIVDGWGSRPADWQAAPVPQGLFATARRAFALCQLGLDPEAPPPAEDGFGASDFAWSGALGPARLTVPDLRSTRTRRRVMDAAAHARLRADVAGGDAPHLLVISSVPLVNADLSLVERAVRPFMSFADLYQDDLRDQWMSHAHRDEWRHVMEALLDAPARVTVLSGEIHLGAYGTARRGDDQVGQFIASGIAHPPPPRALARLHDVFARRPFRRAGLDLEMHPIHPDGRRFLAERNWLEVTAHSDRALDAVLHGERSGALTLPGLG